MELKRPLGTLVTGSPRDSVEKLRDILEREKPTKIIAVGDFTAKTLVDAGIPADLYIVDNRVMRTAIEPVQIQVNRSVKVSNPRGEISAEAWDAVDEALRAALPARIVVDGEEDLLALPAVVCAPEGSVVLYGQPGQGVVVVRVDEEKRREIMRLMDRMEREE